MHSYLPIQPVSQDTCWEHDCLLRHPLCFIPKCSSLCSKPFKGFTLWSWSIKGVEDQTVSWSALLCHHPVPIRRCCRYAKNHVSSKCPSVVPYDILARKWNWNDPSVWWSWFISLQSALQRAIYPIWNTPIVYPNMNIHHHLPGFTMSLTSMTFFFCGTQKLRSSRETKKRKSMCYISFLAFSWPCD